MCLLLERPPCPPCPCVSFLFYYYSLILKTQGTQGQGPFSAFRRGKTCPCAFLLFDKRRRGSRGTANSHIFGFGSHWLTCSREGHSREGHGTSWPELVVLNSNGDYVAYTNFGRGRRTVPAPLGAGLLRKHSAPALAFSTDRQSPRICSPAWYAMHASQHTCILRPDPLSTTMTWQQVLHVIPMVLIMKIAHESTSYTGQEGWRWQQP